MAETRPSGLPLFEKAHETVLQDVAEIDQRSRLHILARWSERLNWLPIPIKEDTEALVVFSEPGRLSLRAWEPDGPKIIQRYLDLASGSGPDYEALRALQDRYGRLAIPRDRRPHLGDASMLHLGLPVDRRARHAIYVSIFDNRLELLSAGYRNEKLMLGNRHLDDLP